jgi:hypothetical protein
MQGLAIDDNELRLAGYFASGSQKCDQPVASSLSRLTKPIGMLVATQHGGKQFAVIRILE